MLVLVAFRDLCPRLGRMARMDMDLGRPAKKDPGRITVRWPCGCLAVGESLRRVSLDACPAHVRTLGPAAARA